MNKALQNPNGGVVDLSKDSDGEKVANPKVGSWGEIHLLYDVILAYFNSFIFSRAE